jgi:NSS family neurotransmitter:Na+ symporter
MGSIGPLFGAVFFILVLVAAVSSSISMTEVLVTFLMDRAALKGKEGDRKKISIGVSLVVLVLAVVVALDGVGSNGLWIPLKEQLAYVKDGVTHYVPFTASWLDFMDCISEGIMMPLGAILMSVMVCWDIKPQYVIEEIGAPMEKKWLRTTYVFCMRVIVPLVMVLVLLGQIDIFFGLGWF